MIDKGKIEDQIKTIMTDKRMISFLFFIHQYQYLIKIKNVKLT